ncbi:Protein FAR1-RELATED SEQUENCE 3 [Striga hermonthica]|uniref:Protein FAR1-RELATED SEQUENCE n=1 Tax=Striga hermonthica TaxID=68872 RepID=A0A9N7R636_STRHE|nr:Protein FAR1-RELATED SEQUENCE 3 [Striga hermonthica]
MDASSRNSTNLGDSGIFPEPHVGMEFDSEKAAKMFYEDYARHLGFAPQVHHERSKSNVKEMCREFLCSVDRFKKGACVAMLRIELSSKNKWTVTKFVKEHSHPTLNHNKLHCIQLKRHFATMGVDVVPTGVMYVSVDGNDFSAGSNNLEFSCQRILGRDAQNVLDYFKKMQAENPGFYYAIHLDDENHMTNAFWADARSRASYSHFGDAVILDTSYRANQYKVPFAPFTGVNHHGQIILFGCALVFDESEAAFIWLFKTFLAAMNNREPVSFTTDDDGAIRDAASQVFPRARHCINKWHVLREGQQRMARVCFTHPKFQVDLYNCINNTEKVEEFEWCWQSIVEKYDLKKNDWLRSIFSKRKRWAPVYFRDSFFATLPGAGPDRSFFNGYVNSQTTLPMFFRQYERALESSFEREVEADFDTMCTTSLLRTPSPMEKQAADLYTKRVFSRFQEELVETFVYTANRVDGDGDNCTYRVAKFEDDRKSYFVSLNIAEMKANCTCMMFEYSGILCRHVLTVFTVTNVLTLPSHYILNRWTRNAKSEGQLEPQGHGTLTERYNNLCKEAIRFAMEGAVTQETYNVALASVREGIKKVGGVKKSVTNVVPSGPLVGGVGCDDKGTNTGNPETTPLLWPRQDEITPRFNLNDAGIFRSVSDAAAICVAPHSLNCNADRADKVPVLPCLKSMTWIMENKDSTPANKIAVINLKLQDYSKNPPVESEVKFSLSRATLEPMLRSMAYITDQLTAPASNVAIINLKLQDPVTTSVESEVKFQLSRDTLGAMLRSMAYIREQLSNTVEPKPEAPAKRLRK